MTKAILGCSVRSYSLVIVKIPTGEVSKINFDLHQVVNPANDFEWAYSIQAEIDLLLDMKVGDYRLVSANRDDHEPAILMRIR